MLPPHLLTQKVFSQHPSYCKRSDYIASNYLCAVSGNKEQWLRPLKVITNPTFLQQQHKPLLLLHILWLLSNLLQLSVKKKKNNCQVEACWLCLNNLPKIGQVHINNLPLMQMFSTCFVITQNKDLKVSLESTSMNML